MIHSALDWLFGLLSVLLGLAVFSVIPVLNLLSLGYLLHSSARVATTGRLRDGLLGVRKASVIGRVLVGAWLVFLPLRFLSALWQDAELISPGGSSSRLWHAGLKASIVEASLVESGFELRSQIIWVKSHFAMSRGAYHWGHEPCWYAVRHGAQASWRGDRAQSTVWAVPNLNPFGGTRTGENAVTGHSTQKPVRLFEMSVRLVGQTQRQIGFNQPVQRLGSMGCGLEILHDNPEPVDRGGVVVAFEVVATDLHFFGG